MQQLIAQRRMYYGTRKLVAGDAFEAEDRHAHLLIIAKAAKAAETPQPTEPDDDADESTAPPKVKRQYRRRDMKAED